MSVVQPTNLHTSPLTPGTFISWSCLDGQLFRTTDPNDMPLPKDGGVPQLWKSSCIVSVTMHQKSQLCDRPVALISQVMKTLSGWY